MSDEIVAPVYRRLSLALIARLNCMASQNKQWKAHWENVINELMKTAPSGAGWDRGTTIDWDKSAPNRLVFFGSYHHLDDVGAYEGWTDHVITVRPHLGYGIEMSITGEDYRSVKEYLYEVFSHWLNSNAGIVAIAT